MKNKSPAAVQNQSPFHDMEAAMRKQVLMIKRCPTAVLLRHIGYLQQSEWNSAKDFANVIGLELSRRRVPWKEGLGG